MSVTALSVDALLDDLESRLDDAVETRLYAEWEAFLDKPCPDGIFSPRRAAPAPAAFPWPQVLVNDTLDDVEAMLAQQFRMCSETLASGNGCLLGVRSNYGVGILPSLFGAEPYIMAREQNCLPNSRALPGGADGIRAMLDNGIPPLTNGWGGKVLETGRRFAEALAPYPLAQKHVHLYHPDLQGPMDVCELVWGSEIFVDLYEEAELVHAALDLITETYARFMREWQRIVPPRGANSMHWAVLIPGQLLLRDDSAMNLSPEMYREFILPYNQRLFDAFGGGAIHACGKVDHWLPVASELRGFGAFNMSQPSYNNMEEVYRHTVDKGIRIIGLDRPTADSALAAGRDLRGLVHG